MNTSNMHAFSGVTITVFKQISPKTDPYETIKTGFKCNIGRGSKAACPPSVFSQLKALGALLKTPSC